MGGEAKTKTSQGEGDNASLNGRGQRHLLKKKVAGGGGGGGDNGRLEGT